MTFGLSAAAMAGVAAAGATVVSGAMQSRSARKAAELQAGAAAEGIDEQQRQFDVVQELLAPYVQGGTQAFQAQQALLGLGGAEQQQQAISALEQSPLYQAQVRQGEQALIQNAAATGQLRGGNLAAALAQFRPQMLQKQIQQQFANLGGLAQYGQSSAARVGAGAQAAGTNIADLLGQQGAAMAGGQLAQGQAFAALPSAVAGGLGIYRGLGGFGGATQPAAPIFEATPMAAAPGFAPSTLEPI